MKLETVIADNETPPPKKKKKKVVVMTAQLIKDRISFPQSHLTKWNML